MSEDFDQVATSVLFENGRVRVWEMTLAPGQASDWHTQTRTRPFSNRLCIRQSDACQDQPQDV